MQPSRRVLVAISVGGIAAVAAGVCCAGPRVAALLGCKVRWLAQVFTELAPFHPGFVAIAAMAFGFAHYRLYGSPALWTGARSRNAELQHLRAALWLLTSGALAMILFPLYAPAP